MNDKQTIRIALASKGELEQPTLDFLAKCGLAVSKTNPRQYIATIPALPGVEVIFQRPPDIVTLVREGDADLGITGYDLVAEAIGLLDEDIEPGKLREDGDLLVLHEALGYGKCALVLAVPEQWLDVETTADLIGVAAYTREKHARSLRVATKYPSLVRAFLYRKGLTSFNTVAASGALEAAPTTGIADLIADISASGTTLRENRLRVLPDGTVVKAQAVLIGNKRNLRQHEQALAAACTMLELIEAYQKARQYTTLTANLAAESASAAAAAISSLPDCGGLLGPTVSSVYQQAGGSTWYTASIVIESSKLVAAVQQLRSVGSHSITAAPVGYLFGESSPLVERLLARVKK